jgi:hypothetical protein
VLLIFVATSITALYGCIIPTIVAGANSVTFASVVAGGWMFVWATCVTIAPFTLMAANAIAGVLNERATTATIQWRNVPAQPVTPLAQIPQSPSLLDLLRGDPNASRITLAQTLAITPQAVSAQMKKLEMSGAITRKNGVVVVAK